MDILNDYIPFNYNLINLSEGTYIPSDFYDKSYTYGYWMRALFQRACYVLKMDNLPFKGRERDFFIYCLYRYGFVSIFDHSEFGLIFQPCTLKGYNLYYQPTDVLISNPSFKQSIELKIDDECALIKLTPDYMGIWDIIRYYAKRLAKIDPAIDVSIANNKTPYIAWGRTKGAIQTLKKLVDKIQSGASAVFYDNRMLDDGNGQNPIEFLDRPNMKQSYLTTEQLADQQNLLKAFDREIGIPTLPYDKKERLVTDEANSAKIDSQSRATIWLECLQESFEIANKMYNLDMSVDFRDEIKGGVIDGIG